MKRAIFDKVLDWRREKAAFALVTDLGSGAQALVREGKAEGELTLGDATVGAVGQAVRQDRSGPVEDAAEGTLFVHVFNPPLRMLVVGAVHVTQPLAAMAERAGYEVTVIDPRRAWATEARFPGVTMVDTWPDEAMRDLAPDARTAVITLTHDPKLDDPALQEALRSEAFYVGCLGSRRTHAKRLDRLREAGFGDDDFARIHGPVGLSIGAKSPAEIAVSILAEVVQVYRQGAAEPKPALRKSA
ncbi:MAG: XdhC family protein [Acetobacterales bacterium]